MAVNKPSKRPALSMKGTSVSSLAPALFKQSVEFSAPMLSLVRLGGSEPSPGRSKPRLEWEKQVTDAKKRAVRALRKNRYGEIDEALLTKFLVFGQHALKVGMTYETIGAPRLKRMHPAKFVAAILRGAK